MYTWGCEGQPLVEVFGVRFHGGEAPTGTISVFDGKRSQIIYSSDKPSSRQTQRSGGRLRLTGPYRAVSADGCVAIVLNLDHQDTAQSSATEILLDVYDEATRYDEPITYSDGRDVEVTYALLSDAAEAVVEVRLLGQRVSCTVGGTVVARTYVGEVVLFDEEKADGARVGTDGVIPLARSVVAVPLTSSLTVEVDLVVGDGDGEEAVNVSVVSEPKLGSEDVQRRLAAGVAAVEVKVTWSD